MSNLTKALKAIQIVAQPASPPGAPTISQYNQGKQTGNATRSNLETICLEIKAERKRLGWSQRKLAIESGYSQGTITRLETRMWISMGCLFAVVNGLGKKLTLT